MQPSALIMPILFCTFASGALHLRAAALVYATYPIGPQETARPDEGQDHTPRSQKSSKPLLDKAKEAWQKYPIFKADMLIYGIAFVTFRNAIYWQDDVRRVSVLMWPCPSLSLVMLCPTPAERLHSLSSAERLLPPFWVTVTTPVMHREQCFPPAGHAHQMVCHAFATPEDTPTHHSTDKHFQPCGAGPPYHQHVPSG